MYRPLPANKILLRGFNGAKKPETINCLRLNVLFGTFCFHCNAAFLVKQLPGNPDLAGVKN